MQSLAERISRTAVLLREASRTVAFTGAGISTDSGISDFRSPGGVWERYRIVTYQEFLESEEARREYWVMKRELGRELLRAKPNRAHTALAELYDGGKLNCVITQNIDGLHQAGGLPPEAVIELHGTNMRALCLSCGDTWPIGDVLAMLDAGDPAPRCPGCGGLIKPATVSFGQAMPEDEMARALECAASADLMLMIGSSLQVEPAASIPPAAKRGGAALVFINRTETPWDHIADVVFRESAAEVMEGLLNKQANP